MWTDEKINVELNRLANRTGVGIRADTVAPLMRQMRDEQAAELERLRAERDSLAAGLERIACPWCGYVQATGVMPHVCDRCERLISMRYMAIQLAADAEEKP